MARWLLRIFTLMKGSGAASEYVSKSDVSKSLFRLVIARIPSYSACVRHDSFRWNNHFIWRSDVLRLLFRLTIAHIPSYFACVRHDSFRWNNHFIWRSDNSLSLFHLPIARIPFYSVRARHDTFRWNNRFCLHSYELNTHFYSEFGYFEIIVPYNDSV